MTDIVVYKGAISGKVRYLFLFEEPSSEALSQFSAGENAAFAKAIERFFEKRRCEEVISISQPSTGCHFSVGVFQHVIFINYEAVIYTGKGFRKRHSVRELSSHFHSRVYGILGHEVNHLLQKVAGYIGYDPRKESEPYCYAFNDVFENGVREFLRFDAEHTDLLGPSLPVKRLLMQKVAHERKDT